MSSDQIVTLLVAVMAGAGASLVTGFFGMPQMRAGAKSTKATGEVSISGDAREWAKTFADRADRSDARALAAEQDAAEVKEKLEECEDRCDALEARLDNWQAYAARLQRDLEAQGIAVPPPPE